MRQNEGLHTSYTRGTEQNEQQTRINILCSDGSTHSKQRDAELGTFSIQLNPLPSWMLMPKAQEWPNGVVCNNPWWLSPVDWWEESNSGSNFNHTVWCWNISLENQHLTKAFEAFSHRGNIVLAETKAIKALTLPLPPEISEAVSTGAICLNDQHTIHDQFIVSVTGAETLRANSHWITTQTCQFSLCFRSQIFSSPLNWRTTIMWTNCKFWAKKNFWTAKNSKSCFKRKGWSHQMLI